MKTHFCSLSRYCVGFLVASPRWLLPFLATHVLTRPTDRRRRRPTRCAETDCKMTGDVNKSLCSQGFQREHLSQRHLGVDLTPWRNSRQDSTGGALQQLDIRWVVGWLMRALHRSG